MCWHLFTLNKAPAFGEIYSKKIIKLMSGVCVFTIKNPPTPKIYETPVLLAYLAFILFPFFSFGVEGVDADYSGAL